MESVAPFFMGVLTGPLAVDFTHIGKINRSCTPISLLTGYSGFEAKGVVERGLRRLGQLYHLIWPDDKLFLIPRHFFRACGDAVGAEHCPKIDHVKHCYDNDTYEKAQKY